MLYIIDVSFVVEEFWIAIEPISLFLVFFYHIGPAVLHFLPKVHFVRVVGELDLVHSFSDFMLFYGVCIVDCFPEVDLLLAKLHFL